MARFQSAFNQDQQKLSTAKQRARRSAAAKLAAAVGYGFERLEQRALFNGSAIANPGGPYTVNEGSSITLDGSASTDNGPITGYKWDLNYTNNNFVASVTSPQATLNYTAGAAIPQRVIALEVMAADGTSSVATTTLTTNDVLPTITVTGGGQVARGATNTINWTYTDPGHEAVTNWLVDWGDGSGVQTLAGSATSSTHAYSSDGNYTATVTSEQTVLGNQVTADSTAAFNVVPVIPVVTLTGNAHVNELASYSLGFSAVDPNPIDNWAIDWGDGTPQDVLPGTATGGTHTYATHGTYTVTTTAIDDAGDSGQTTKTVIADDVPPAPTTSGGPQGSAHINEGDTVNLTVTPHDPGSLNGTTYAWTVTSTNGSFSLPGNTVTNTASLSFVAGYKGTYTATCTVTDDAGMSTPTVTTIIADAVAPTVTLTSGYSTSINKGGSVSLTANPADVGTNDTYTYAWTATLNGQPYTLASGSTTGQTFNLVAGRSGSFIAKVVVTDRDNGTAMASTSTITAAAVAPTAAISGEPGPIGEGTAFTLTDTPSDVGVSEAYMYAWTLTKTVNSVTTTVNLASPIVTNASTFTYTPEDEGTYVATCVVTDSDGSTVSTSSQNIVVSNVAPTVAITGATSPINEGTAVNLTATPTEASTDRTYTYLWTVARTYNGSTTSVTLANGSNTSAALSFTPATEGTYVATCVVTDDEGGSTTQASSNIVVATVPATVTVTGDSTTEINEGTAVNLAASSTEPGSGHTFNYSWSVSKNGSPYQFGAAGTATASASTGNQSYQPAAGI